MKSKADEVARSQKENRHRVHKGRYRLNKINMFIGLSKDHSRLTLYSDLAVSLSPRPLFGRYVNGLWTMEN